MTRRASVSCCCWRLDSRDTMNDSSSLNSKVEGRDQLAPAVGELDKHKAALSLMRSSHEEPLFSSVLRTPLRVLLLTLTSSARWRVCISPQIHGAA